MSHEDAVLEDAVTRIQCTYRRRAARSKTAAKREELRAARQALAEAEQEEATTKLQSLQRGRAARREVDAMRLERARLKAAATRLQSVYRGRVARRKTAAKRAGVKAREHELSGLEKAEQEATAALTMQTLFRGGVARLEAAGMSHEDAVLEDAVARIQCTYRRRAARSKTAAKP